MKNNILVLFFTVSFVFLCIPQLFAQQDDSSPWLDFFGLLSSENPAKDRIKEEPLLNMNTGSENENYAVEEENLIQPEFSDPEVLKNNIIEAPPIKSIANESSLQDDESPNIRVLNKNIVEVSPIKPINKEDSLTKSLPMKYFDLKKNMVKVPHLDKNEVIDAGDFRDPFMLLRGGTEDLEKVLEPGVTVDGVQFNSYNDSDVFVEKVYNDSRFRIKDIFGKVEHMEGGGCLYCHQGIERISKSHKFRCTKCHEGNRRKKTLPAAHKNMIANPSDLDHAPKYCGKCHADQIEQVEQSSMATGKSVINITRYAWGAQQAGENIYSLRPKGDSGEQLLPKPPEGEVVDAFLRTKCMRCHLQSESPHRPGDYRASGCAACHMIYSNDGQTLTQDRAIQSKIRKNQTERESRFKRKFATKSLKNPRGYPVLHKFTTAVPSVQCEHCHNNNGIGNEFEGLFAHTARLSSGFSKTGIDKPVLYGTEHEFLLPDIHRERGMDCIDCHVGTDFKGAPSGPELHSGVEIRCENCHGTPSKTPEAMLVIESDSRTKRLLASNALNPNLKGKVKLGDLVLVNSGGAPLSHIKKEKDKWILFSKVTGKKHTIPLLAEKQPVVAHKIKRHMEAIECHACHARWSTGEWGMNIIRKDNLNFKKWEDWNFSDPTLQDILWKKDQMNVGMIDWLSAKWMGNQITGSKIPGVFINLFTETDWNTMILGKNQRGKYSIMKPRYQYFFTDSYADKESVKKSTRVAITQDGGPGLILLPHTPHTIRTIVRPCESCHDSEISLGLGEPNRKTITDSESFLLDLKNNNFIPSDFQAKQVVTEAGDSIQKTYPKDKTRFLNAEEIAVIKNKSDAYKAYRYMDLKERRFSRLLTREKFPFDQLHKKNEESAGNPKKEKDILYDLNGNSYLNKKHGVSQLLKPNLSDPALGSQVDPKKNPQNDLNLNDAPIKQEIVMEFSPTFFKSSTSIEELDTNKSISTENSGFSSEELK